MNGKRIGAFLAALAALLAYLNSLPAPFQFDDFNIIVDNPFAHTLPGFIYDALGGIRPLLKLTYYLNWIMGPGPAVFHLANILIHAASALVVYLLGLRFARKFGAMEREGLFAALFAALLFALHPVRTEAVAYISGRSSSLMALFCLSALYFFDRGRGEEGRTRHRILAYLFFLMAVLVKETALVLPLFLLLWERGGKESPLWRETVRSLMPYLLTIGAALAVLALKPAYLRHFTAGEGMGGLELVLRQSHGLLYLLGQYFTFAGQNIDPHFTESFPPSPQSFAKALLAVSLFLAGVELFRRKRPEGFALLWFFVALSPTNTIFPRPDGANERHLYLAMIGAEWAGALLFFRHLPQRRSAKVFAALLLCLALGLATVKRNSVYRSEVSLWEDTAAKSPGKARVHNNLGYAYLLAGNAEKAKATFTRALALDPGFEKARNNLAKVPLEPAGPSPERK